MKETTGMHDWITSDKFLQLEKELHADKRYSLIYIKMDALYQSSPIMWRNELHTWRKANVWITGHSDYGVTPDIYYKYKSQNHVWFTFNKEVCAPNHLFALPLGLTNDCDDSPIHRIYGNTQVMQDVLDCAKGAIASDPAISAKGAIASDPAKGADKEGGLVYMSFSIHTYPALRNWVWNYFQGQPWVTAETPQNTLESRRAYLAQIARHKFVLCPRGNGIDTHRLWETLYMGSIPVVQRHVALEEFHELPIMWIDAWEEVTEDRLRAEYENITSKTWNLEKLQFSYWEAKIRSHASIIP